jgi:hypothetical protein
VPEKRNGGIAGVLLLDAMGSSGGIDVINGVTTAFGHIAYMFKKVLILFGACAKSIFSAYPKIPLRNRKSHRDALTRGFSNTAL